MRRSIILSACLISIGSLSRVAKVDAETAETGLSAVDAKGRAVTLAPKEAGQSKLEVSRKATVRLDGEPATFDRFEYPQIEGVPAFGTCPRQIKATHELYLNPDRAVSDKFDEKGTDLWLVKTFVVPQSEGQEAQKSRTRGAIRRGDVFRSNSVVPHSLPGCVV